MGRNPHRDTLIEGLQGLFPNTSFYPFDVSTIVVKLPPIGDVFIAVSRTGREVSVSRDSREGIHDGYTLARSPATAQEVAAKIGRYIRNWLEGDAQRQVRCQEIERKVRWLELLRVLSSNPDWRQVAAEIVAEKRAEINQRLAYHLESSARTTAELEEEIRGLVAYEDKFSGKSDPNFGSPLFDMSCVTARHCDTDEVYAVEGGFFRPWGYGKPANLPKPTRPEGYPEPGPWAHFKGGMYNVLGTTQDVNTLEHHVVYQTDGPEGTVWLRPLAQWTEIINRENYHGPRFFKAQQTTTS